MLGGKEAEVGAGADGQSSDRGGSSVEGAGLGVGVRLSRGEVDLEGLIKGAEEKGVGIDEGGGSICVEEGRHGAKVIKLFVSQLTPCFPLLLRPFSF